MEKDVTIPQEQLDSMTALVEEMQSQSGNDKPYKDAAVSITFSGGPSGALTEGWFTYLTGEKYYYQGNGSMVYGLPVAMGVLAPIALVLPHERLANAKHVTWEASGSGTSGVLIIRVDGDWISPTPFICAGAGIGPWKVEGKASFRRG